MAIRLRITHPNEPSREARYGQPGVTIGREPSNVLRLSDASNAVSRRHAVIRQGSQPEIVDLGSRNGTFVNGDPVEANRPRLLRAGDTVQVGPFQIEVLDLLDTSSTPDATTREDSPAEFLTLTVPARELRRLAVPGEGASPVELRRAADEVKVLHELALSLGSSFDKSEIMDRVVHRSIDLIGAEEGLISLLDEDNDDAQIRTMIRTGQSFRVNSYLQSWMVRNGEALLLNDPGRHPDFQNVRWEDSLRNLISVPLVLNDDLMGLLTVYNKRDGGGFSESDLRLLSIIGSQAAQIISNARLFEEKQKLIRIEEQLGVALEIQQRLLPSGPPTIDGYDVAGASVAAQTVGGDHFDYIPIDDQRTAFALGDVSGKGLPAALVMANLQATLRAHSMWSPSVSACMEATNVLLHRSTNRRTFVTLFYGVLDAGSHTFTFANAGHNRPYVVGRSDVTELGGAGFLLGGVAAAKYQEHQMTFEPGMTLVIFSDGVVEARSNDGSLYGEERLIGLLEDKRGSAASDIVESILTDVREFARGEPQSDDVTVLVLRRN